MEVAGIIILLPVIIGNSVYCLLTASLVCCFISRLTIPGVAYFVGEILIILGLVCVELRTLRRVG